MLSGNTGAILVAILFAAVSNLLQLALPLYSMQVFDRVLPTGSLPTLAAITLVMVFVTAIAAVVEGARSALVLKIATRIHLSLHREILSRSGRALIEGTLASDLDNVRAYLTSPLTGTILDAPWSLAYVVALMCVSPKIGVIAITAAGLIIAISLISSVLSKQQRRQSEDAAVLAASVGQRARQTDDASRAMGVHHLLVERWFNARLSHAVTQLHWLLHERWWESVSRSIRAVVQVAVIAVAAILVIDHEAQISAIVAGSMLLTKALAPVERLCPAISGLRNFGASLRRIRTAMSELGSKPQYLRLPPLRGEVTMVGVSFIYPGRSPVLVVKDLTIHAGEFLVVVGDEGAGKSTFAGLVAGALRPSTGIVRYDGSNALDFKPSELGSQIGYLPEGGGLLLGTVSQIISRDIPGLDAETVVAAEMAGAHRLVQRLGNGYQTCIGPDAWRLSAGERLRIGLARAFFRRPALIVLDEPLVGLDPEGKEALMLALRALKRSGSTVVIVSRDPHLLPLSDTIIMFRDGKVVLHAPQYKFQALLGPRLATAQPVG